MHCKLNKANKKTSRKVQAFPYFFINIHDLFSGDYSARISASAASRNALLGASSPLGSPAHHQDSDFEPYDNNVVSVLGQQVGVAEWLGGRLVTTRGLSSILG